MKKLSNTEAELKKSVPYKKKACMVQWRNSSRLSFCWTSRYLIIFIKQETHQTRLVFKFPSGTFQRDFRFNFLKSNSDQKQGNNFCIFIGLLSTTFRQINWQWSIFSLNDLNLNYNNERLPVSSVKLRMHQKDQTLDWIGF